MTLIFKDSQGRRRESNHNSLASLLDESFYQYKKKLTPGRWLIRETDDALEELIDGITNDIKNLIK